MKFVINRFTETLTRPPCLLNTARYHYYDSVILLIRRHPTDTRNIMSDDSNEPNVVTPDNVQSSKDAQSTKNGTAQGLAARLLLASLINDPELADVKRHQTAT